METILEFFVNNYMWFLVISLILIFGLIGYIVDVNEKKSPKLHFQKDNDINLESKVVAEGKTLNELLKEKEQIQSVEMANNLTEENTVDNLKNMSNQELP